MSKIDALQQTLAGEHAAMYVLGVCAAQVSQSQEPDLWARIDRAWGLHRASRDWLVARITRLGAEPVAAHVAYRLPNAMTSSKKVTRAAHQVESRMTATYAAHVAGTVSKDRQWGLTALTESALRELWFRGIPEILPGTSST